MVGLETPHVSGPMKLDKCCKHGCSLKSGGNLSADDNLFCPCCTLPVMMEILPSRCVPIAKKEILYMGTFGIACWLSGLIFIDRKKKEESITVLTDVAQSLHKENVSGEDAMVRSHWKTCGWKGVFVSGLGTEQDRERASPVGSVCCVSIKYLKWRKWMSLHGQEQTDQSQGSTPEQWLGIVTGGPSISMSSLSCSSVS